MAAPSPGGFAPDEPTPRKSGKAGSPSGWRDEAAIKGGSNKTVLVVVTLFAIVAIGGAIAALLITPDPPSDPLFVAVPFGEYPTPWSPPPAVYRDAALVTDSFPDRGGRPTPAQTFNYQEREKFEGLLSWVEGSGKPIEGGPDDLSKRPLVLAVSGLAAVNDKTVYLLPANARPADPSSWIPASRILDAMANSKAKKKFLILDLAYPTADPYGGTLRDDAAARLDELLAAREKANGLPFAVLTSAGPGELSLPMYPQRCSGFAFYLSEGLRGGADGYQDNTTRVADLNKTVTVGEVSRFVRYRVERWARVAHERQQGPKIYGLNADTDFILSDVKGDPVPDPAPPAPYPDALKAGWDDRAAARGRGEHRPFPAEFARLTQGLLRAERVWRESGDADRTQGAWSPAQKDWDQKVRDSAGKDPVADVYANALAVVAGQRLVVDLQGKTAPPPAYVPLREMMREQAIVTAMEAMQPLPLDKEKEFTRAKDAVKEKAKAWEDAVKDADTRTRMFWDVIAEDQNPTAELVKYWKAELGSAKVTGRNKATSEVMLVNALTEGDLTYTPEKRALPEYPDKAVAALFRAETALSQLLAAGPNGFGLVVARVQEGEALRKKGQDALFIGTRDECERAHVPLAEAVKKYQEARADLMRWQEASQTVETATAILVDALPGEMIGEKPVFDRWRSAVEKTSKLADVLSAARAAGQFRADQVLPVQVSEVRRAAEEIRVSFVGPKDDEQPAVGLGATRAKPIDSLPLERLIASTLISPARRKAVWDALQADAARFHASVQQDDATDVTNETQTRNALPAKLGDRPTEDELVVRRGQASVSLLMLAGHPGAGQVAGLLEPLIRASNSVDAARTLGDELRTAWLKEFPDTARARRVAPPGLSPYRATTSAGEPPGLADANADVAAYKAAARTALETDRPLRGNTATGKTFYPTALRSVSQ